MQEEIDTAHGSDDDRQVVDLKWDDTISQCVSLCKELKPCFWLSAFSDGD